MGTFSASLRAIGDVKALPATVEILEGNLKIAAGSTEIGSWPLDEIQLEEIPTGYRMLAEGDQILLELKDVAAFSAALANVAKRKKLGRVRKIAQRPKKAAPADPSAVTEKPLETPISAAPTLEVAHPRPIPAPAARREPSETTTSPSKKKFADTGIGHRALDAVDTLLIGAKKRFGAYLPDFMFSRAMFGITLAALIALIVFPGVFSPVLLIAGVLLVMFGAVVYGDSMLAARFLPGRATPQQALLLGLGVLLLGVVLGAIAK
ncbi:MAG TPA: hypothetical protein VMM14_05530 [Acidimicrobiia bacterium]|nr:hypothetical protein [Acidimicrobiia bacterium]